MKTRRILVWALALPLLVHGVCAVRLSERATREFLDELEALSLRNEMPAYCERLHDDLVVVIEDRTAAEGPQDVSGGKREYCEFVARGVEGLDLLGPEMTVTRENFTVERSWLRPWIARVSYHEKRTTHMTRVDFTLHTEADDRWTLVDTLDGTKVLRLESRSWRAR